MAIKSDGAQKEGRSSIRGAAHDFNHKSVATPNRRPTKAAPRLCLLPYNIPIVRTKGRRDGFQNSDPVKKWLSLAAEIEKRCAGPMPAEEFIEAFLPAGSTGDDAMPPAKEAFKSVPTADYIKTKMDICCPLVSGLKDTC